MKQNKQDTPYDGTVNWFSSKLGYGFIQCEQFEKALFVHWSRVVSSEDYRSLSKGQMVSFEVVRSEKGLMAVNVREAKVITPKVEFVK